MNTATVPQIALPSAPVAYETQVVNMLERVVRDLTIDPGRVKEFMELHERAISRLAETSFNEAMASAQSEIERVAPDSHNAQTRSKYASYAAMDAAIRDIYSRHGFALSFGTEESSSVGCIRIVCDVSKGAYVKRYHIEMPADGKGARGNDVMTRTHATGSAVTYGRRYLLAMIFNVAVGEVDDDGNGASRKSARQLKDEIAQLPDDERHAAEQAMHERWSDRQAGALSKSMVENDEIWDETEVRSKTAFLGATRDHIRLATDGDELLAWWNSDEQKQARRDFDLSPRELKPLKEFAERRIKELRG